MSHHIARAAEHLAALGTDELRRLVAPALGSTTVARVAIRLNVSGVVVQNMAHAVLAERHALEEAIDQANDTAARLANENMVLRVELAQARARGEAPTIL